jgi:predicted transcriptional regulator
MKHRSEEEITALILEAAAGNTGVTQTTIMYKAFLTYSQLKAYLLLLTEKGLIEFRNLERVYCTTNKGMQFLQMYNQIIEVINATKQIK